MDKIKYLFLLFRAEMVKYKYQIIIGLLLIQFSTIITYLFPWFSIKIIDEVIPGKEIKKLFLMLSGLILLYLINLSMVYQYQLIFIKIREHFGNILQQNIFNHFFKIKYQEFETIDESEIYSYTSNDITNIKKVFGLSSVILLKEIFSFLYGIVFMYSLLPVYTSIILIIIVLSITIIFKYSLILREKDKLLIKLYGKTNSSIIKPLLNFLSVRIFNLSGMHSKTLINNQAHYYDSIVSIFKLNRKIFLTKQSLGNFITVSIFLFSGIKIINGDFSIGKLIGYNFYFAMVMSATLASLTFYMDFQSTFVSIDRIKKLFSIDKESIGNYKLLPNEKISKLEFKNISFYYPNRKNRFSLKDTNFHINQGEIMAIVGKNGSGKSTILKLLLGIYDNYKGEILINGKELKEYDIWKLRDKIGYIPQEIFFFDGSLKDNIILGGHGNQEKLNELIYKCGLGEFIDCLDEKLDFVIKSKEVFLSNGYKQKIGFARALYKNPELIIIDEGLNSLDILSESEMKKLLSDLKNRNIPVIVISHRLSAIDFANRILVIDNGKIVDYRHVEYPENIKHILNKHIC